MATDSRNAAFEVAAVTPRPFAVRSYSAAADYWALTKPEINFLIAIATFAGFYLGCPAQLQGFPFVLLIHTLLGTLLVASGAGMETIEAMSFPDGFERYLVDEAILGQLTADLGCRGANGRNPGRRIHGGLPLSITYG
jgi:hypothetical protein